MSNENTNRQPQNLFNQATSGGENSESNLEHPSTISQEQTYGEEEYYGAINAPKLTKKSVMSKPKVTMGFNSLDAVKLLTGHHRNPDGKTVKEKGPFQKGLDTFDRDITKVYAAIINDDPIADQLLFNIESSVKEVRAIITDQSTQIQRQIEDKFARYDAMASKSKDSVVATFEPNYRNSISTHLLWLAADIDQLFFDLYVAANSLVITNKVAQSYRHNALKNFRRVLHMVDHYKHTGITRKDIGVQTARSASAIEKNPKIALSREVLLCEQRSDCAPRITGRRQDKIEEPLLSQLLDLVQKATETVNEEQKVEFEETA